MPDPRAPIAERRPHVHVAHGDERPDDYAWMRDRDDPAVVAHLEAENAYADLALAPAAPTRDAIVAEISARIPDVVDGAPEQIGRAHV